MSQVIVEMYDAASANAGKAQVYPRLARAEEITSSVTSQATSIEGTFKDVCTVVNNGADTIWVKIGSSPTAAVTQDFIVVPNTQRDFGPLEIGDKVAVINDS